MSEERKEPAAFTIKKKVDESWKDSVAKEKSKDKPPAPEAPESETASEAEAPPEAGFELLIAGLGAQVIGALNEGKLDQSRYLIDTLQMLAEKTQGNLTPEESQGLQEMLYQLQLQFVKKSQNA